MSDFNLVDPQAGWECDLHSVYSAYLGHFQIHNIAWYDKTWGDLFQTFESFLGFGWPVIIVTDVYSGRAHIVTKKSSISAFIKMVRTRFGETLPLVDNIIKVRPFENQQRHMRHISELPFYKKLHATLPAAFLAAQKARIRAGEPAAIQQIWDAKDKNFLAVDFEWSEKNPNTCLEWGYAALRSAHVQGSGIWPPSPRENYRKGHFIISDYVDKMVNKRFPNFPLDYAFGESQLISKGTLSKVIQAVIDSLASPESETRINDLVLVAHGASGDLERMVEMKIRIPSNVLVVDTTTFERQLFLAGRRPELAQLDPYNPQQPRQPGSTLSLTNLLRTVGIEPERTCKMHNAGNDAFMALTALQLLLEPSTKINELQPRSGTLNVRRSVVGTPMGMAASLRNLSVSPTAAKFNTLNVAGTPTSISRPHSIAKDLSEWGVRQSGYATTVPRTGVGAGLGAGAAAGAGISLSRNGQHRRGRSTGQPQPQQGKDVQSAMEQLLL